MKLNKLFFVINAQDPSNIENNCATGELLLDPSELYGYELQSCRNSLERAYSSIHNFKCKVVFWFEVKSDLSNEDFAKS